MKLELTKKARQVLKKYPDKVFPALMKGMGRSMIDIEAYIKRNKLSGQVLNVRTGNLRRSIHHRVKTAGNKAIGSVGTPLIYGSPHETGKPAYITPTIAQWLTIPLEGARTAMDVGRGRARSFANTFFLKSKAGNLLLMQRKGSDIIPLFVLKKRVKVIKRPYLRPGIIERLPAVRKYVVQEITKAYGGVS